MRSLLRILTFVGLASISFGHDGRAVDEDPPAPGWDAAVSTTGYPNEGCNTTDGCVEGNTGAGFARLFEQTEDRWVQFGGSYRFRYHDENNMRSFGLTGRDDTFQLHQTRIWMDATLNETLTIHGEIMDAASFGEAWPSRGGEVNRTDLYQLYADITVPETDGSLTARLGRQELRFGSDRLIMAPIWANRRRNHDGARLMWESEDWTVDAFWVRPVIRDATNFDSFDNADLSQQLYGVFATRTASEQAKQDLYWLAYDGEGGSSPDIAGARYDTIGSRHYGGTPELSYELEGAYQFGVNSDDSMHSAGFVTGGLGRTFEGVAWNPDLWVFYDWASGSDTTGNGFHSYLPRAHYYLGNMDLFGRRNLQDASVRLTTKPLERVTFVMWYHYFMLANGNDVPYNLNMRPFAGLPAGSAGSKDLGHELDFTVTWQVTEQTQLLLGYNYFWAGRFYDTTPGVPSNADGDFLYAHVLVEF